jgi:IS30 family transposase
MVMISQRPAEAAEGGRARPLGGRPAVIGTDCTSAVGTLVERTTRSVMVLHLPAGRDARLVEQAMRQAIGGLPGELACTVTFDQGKEMAFHAGFTIATGIGVSCCDPHQSWQRGSNEHTNGLLRQQPAQGNRPVGALRR